MRPESTSVTFRPDLAAEVREYDSAKAAKRFIARKVAPIFESATCEGGYPIINRENFKKPVSTKRTNRGKYNRITGQFGKGTYDCEENGLEYPVDDRMRRKYSHILDAEAAAAKIARYQILLNQEIRVAAAFAAAGLTNTNVATAWSTTASAVPLDDIMTQAENLEDACGIGREWLSLIIPRADYREMMKTDSVVDRVKYVYGKSVIPALLPVAEVASCLGIKEVLIAAGGYDSKEEGVAESNTQIWTAGVIYLGVFCDEGDPLEEPSAARTILWTGDSPESPVVESYREEDSRGDIIRVRHDTDEVMIGEADLFVRKLTNT